MPIVFADMSIDVRLIGAADAHLLERVAPEVFDSPIDGELTAEFIDDPRHHLAVAVDDGLIVGMASAVHYVHPDKLPQLFINEVAVATSHHRRGLARRMLDLLVRRAGELGCTEAWVLTDRQNVAAMRLYASAGGGLPEDCIMFTIPVMGTEDFGDAELKSMAD